MDEQDAGGETQPALNPPEGSVAVRRTIAQAFKICYGNPLRFLWPAALIGLPGLAERLVNTIFWIVMVLDSKYQFLFGKLSNSTYESRIEIWNMLFGKSKKVGRIYDEEESVREEDHKPHDGVKSKDMRRKGVVPPR